MRRAARQGASRLLASLQTQPAAWGGLGGPRALAPTACSVLASAQAPQLSPTAAWQPCTPWAPSCLARSLATAPRRDEGPLKQFRLAQTGEGIKECELVQWFVAEGDAVEAFGRICEVQSDKATMEITSPYAGIVRKLHHTPGDVIQVGDVLADILAEGGDGHLNGHVNGHVNGHAASPAAAAAAAAGGGPGSAPGQEQRASSSGGAGEEEAADRVLTSPAVRRLARDHGISLAQVQATGPGGRVLKGDVLAYLDALDAAGPGNVADHGVHGVPAAEEATASGTPAAAAAAQAGYPSSSSAAAGGYPAAAAAAATGLESEVVPLKGYRKAMLKSMTAAGQVPHFHFCEEVQMDALVELRNRLREDPSMRATKLTFLPFFLKAAALALQQYPLVNASLAPDQAAVLQHRRVNLGIAMATPHGLAVPNIKDVQDKTVVQLAAELARLQAAAAENKLTQADISGGTFTISNIGTIGGTYATPLVNPPEVAIMAVGRVQRLPRFAADGVTVVPSNVMAVSLGGDHRVVDGATLAGFALAWRQYVESPGKLLLHLR